jgi:Tfp pilus assembly protein PilV
LLAERIKGESGYSLVEVMASIVILTIAILPMVGMFDMGLQTATKGSNYDKSRALANLKLEEAKSLPFASLQDNFPAAGSTPDATTGYYDSGFIPASAPFTNFQYRIEKQYMQKPTEGSVEWEPSGTPTDLIRITVTVQWADGNEYHTLGLVSA